MRIDVRVYDKGLRTRIRNFKTKLDTKTSATVKEIAQLVKMRAKYLAPKDTRLTADFIKSWVTSNRGGYKVVTVGYVNGGFGKGNPHPLKKWGGAEFSLPLWMHTSKRALDVNWKNGGSPRFLYEASAMTRKDFRRRIEANIMEST